MPALSPETRKSWQVRYKNQDHATCCAGCHAVANAILNQGLAAYYEHRTQAATQAQPLPEDLLMQIQLYDEAVLQADFVRQVEPPSDDADIREAVLILEGITCSACVWLNEQHLKGLSGVLEVGIHYTSHRARVQWDNTRCQLSTILSAIAAIGYRAHPYSGAQSDALRAKAQKMASLRLWCAGLSMMQVMMYIVPIYLAKAGEVEPEFLWLLHTVSLILTLPVMLFSATPFYQGLWRDLKSRVFGMDTPVALGILTAFFGSLWAWWHKAEHGVYFDAISMFVFLLLGGRYLENLARQKTAEATDRLMTLTPDFSHLQKGWPQSGLCTETPTAHVLPDDVILVKQGEIFPADGVLIEGLTEVSEAMLTGESLPVAKKVGDDLVAGTLNLSMAVSLRVTQVGANTRLASISRLLDKALTDKPRFARLADQWAAVFVAVLLVLALATFGVWFAIDPSQALWMTVAVLVVSCPCALSLATPAALTAATGHLAKLGVIVTQGHALESLSSVTDVVLDKTGTLTLGEMRVVECQQNPDLPAHAAPKHPPLALAAALESHSTHPIATAFRTAATPADLEASDLAQFLGLGVSGNIDDVVYFLGNRELIATKTTAMLPDTGAGSGTQTQLFLSSPTHHLATFILSDTLRAEADSAVFALQEAGFCVHLLSGDQHSSVKQVADALGIKNAVAAAQPETKLAYVKALQAEGKRVLMIGDGINDAPVLAGAAVSIAMGSGSSLTQATGDLILLNNHLDNLPRLLRIAQLTRRIILQNLTWAVVYNVMALPLAMTGHLTPALASLGMASSSLLVTLNALRLLPRK
jgi:Cu2+-exporting ATPase